jgi:hypothetical protein
MYHSRQHAALFELLITNCFAQAVWLGIHCLTPPCYTGVPWEQTVQYL